MVIGSARVFAVVLLLSAFSSLASAAVRTIVFKGDDAAGTGEGAVFSQFTLPSLNNRGQVAFGAQLIGADVTPTTSTGHWIASDDAIRNVVRAGEPAPGMPAGTTFGSISNIFLAQVPINDAGEIAVGVSATQTSGLWIGNHESLTLLAKQGDAAPGAQNNSIYGGLGGIKASLNRRGDVSFMTYINGEPYNSITPGSNYYDGLWVINRNGVKTSVLAGQSLPELGAEAQLYGFNTFPRPALNSLGEVAYAAFHRLSAGSQVRTSLWTASDDERDLHGYWSQPIPNVHESATVNSFTAPGFNSDGVVVVNTTYMAPAAVPSSGSAIAVSDGENLTIPAFVAGPAPSLPGYEISSAFYEPSLGSGGHIAFYASVSDGVTSRSGVWTGLPDTLQPIALQGEAAPNANATFNAFFRDTPALNRFGQVAFPAGLTDSQGGGVTSSLWASNLVGELELIARAGTLLEVAPGDVRTFSSVSMLTNHGDDDGRPRGLNDLGQIVFRATFTDSTSGIFLSNAVAHLPGDYNGDGTVDTGDYLVWRKSLATQNLMADGDRNGIVDAGDHALWSEFFGMSLALDSGVGASSSVPEPGAAALVAIFFCAMSLLPRRAK